MCHSVAFVVQRRNIIVGKRKVQYRRLTRFVNEPEYCNKMFHSNFIRSRDSKENSLSSSKQRRWRLIYDHNIMGKNSALCGRVLSPSHLTSWYSVYGWSSVVFLGRSGRDWQRLVTLSTTGQFMCSGERRVSSFSMLEIDLNVLPCCLPDGWISYNYL